jgi:hypothetical protein
MPGASEVPPFRPLRVFAFDPSLALQLKTLEIHEVAIRVPWERDAETGRLTPGPVGEYLEVIDVDPASGVVYPPVELDDPNILAQDGLRPSEGNPQFHQQMVYAVAMATITHFERALGRVALWAAHRPAAGKAGGDQWQVEFVRRLRIYPHALRDQNAYYSPDKKAVLFGYFPVSRKDAYNTPGTTVFTCLSHDIVAHEVTHALLDGIHPRFNEPSNPDVLAFHEAFADIVALFQHFSYPSILRDQIAGTSGDLDSENLLGKLAQQFGQATGRGAALRDYLRKEPDPAALDQTVEPHDRGAILVAAVFAAFLRIYRVKTRDLFRIASNGTGLLQKGELHPDLTKRLAQEASEAALAILQSCIRALDYCPPVNITFGHYLRAIVTADLNFNADELARTAIIESFREWGIYPRGIRSMSVEALRWPSGSERIADIEAHDSRGAAAQRTLPSKEEVKQACKDSSAAITELLKLPQLTQWDLHNDRFELWKIMQENRRAMWHWLVKSEGTAFAPAFGVLLDAADTKKAKSIFCYDDGTPKVEIHSVRTALRRNARGGIASDLIVEITQRRRGYFNAEKQKKVDADGPLGADDEGDFIFRAGCTIVIDLTGREFRHIIRTAGSASDVRLHGTVADNDELERVRAFLTEEAPPSVNAFVGEKTLSLKERAAAGWNEPFALLHRHAEESS